MAQRFSGSLPFTNAEVFEVFALINPPDIVEAFRDAHDRPPDEPTDVAVTDDILLVFAAVSAEYADRVVGFRPDLKAEVLRVRADPETFLAAERRRMFESHERERGEHS